MGGIKFRAWDKKLKKFHPEGTVCIDYSGIPFQLGSIDKEHSEKKQFRFVELDEMEINRFIGLLDKNGKEIYEADVVTVDGWKGTYKVDFDRGGFCFYRNDSTYANDVKYLERGKVIGNIYENPELLKE